MNQKLLIALAITGCLTISNAENTVNFEEDRQNERIKKHKLTEMKNLVTKIDILLDEAIIVGEDSLASLEKNLIFLTKIETDPKFRNCVILKENRKKILSLRESAKELLDEREITQAQYNRYIKKLEDKEKKFDKKISNQECK